ncbi:hypothetical protein Rsub_06940 [Raphidocelis subcapitata]|uniref:Uncharacterized protein n=1 Tax=Raphidocelis subcapitata TaxID=307507 RepID=A0A2V0P375_9CHLO|nr:hypothetical protein Rsub_06940 [Raphidocelis subcapitata]|eukprot:GBF94318.1 hypothetical protein Rsub_06940 [Raphidocelis subcapitata]
MAAFAASTRASMACGSAKNAPWPGRSPLVARRPFTSCAECARRGPAAPAVRGQQRGAAGGRRLELSRPNSVPTHRVCFFGFGADDEEYEDELTVAKLQVGMFGPVEEFKRELDKLASLMDTENEGAMQELERLVFKKETLSNVAGRLDRRALREEGADVGLDKWLGITLLVAVERSLKLPKVRSLADLKASLTMLGGLITDEVVAVELLWTPQEEGDSYSKEELLADYPSLANL